MEALMMVVYEDEEFKRMRREQFELEKNLVRYAMPYYPPARPVPTWRAWVAIGAIVIGSIGAGLVGTWVWH
jgi:hypothetical protein